MEHNREILKDALQNLPSYEPKEMVWNDIDRKLNELPLQQALASLPEYEPDDRIWEVLELNSQQKRKTLVTWWYAAAVLLLVGPIGFWFVNKDKGKIITYSEEVVDERLQTAEIQETDNQYQKLKAWCESETLVCNTVDFKQLKEEYETLQLASEQLQAAMGNYNSEPELVRQLSMVEQEKAGILNKMAKMI
ncbi:hypothetical protein [Dyadobacter sp. CY312]|uniref:hypothetical protein n=1 Tax=Dyadobacter sp. CY312 TaxID=2907303 RepID=UPI001F37D09A|nr:hypothetical protein [Dyadobacter sp. CY312]MCE7042999.1 hypothetical protein [Dyadobacter sp. CY312]